MAPPLSSSQSHITSTQLQSQQRASNNSSGSLQQGPPSPVAVHSSDPIASLFGSRLLRRISNQGGTSTGSGGSGANGTTNPNVISSSALAPSATLTAFAASQQSNSSQTNPAVPAASGSLDVPSSSSQPNASTSDDTPSATTPNFPTHRLRLVPVLDSTASLPFDPILRDVRQSQYAPPPNSSLYHDSPGVWPLKIGRFSDKQNGTDGNPRGGALTSSKIAFKSKVVSRCHAEIWVVEGGNFYVRDTKSSSGTFLNHLRLAAPGQESKPFPLKDGDVVQLGVDYQGGTEDIYRSIKMRVEIGRAWQSGANNFNTNALRQLNALGGPGAGSDAASVGKGKKVSRASVTDCCICLFSVTICQSLFIAPCSHVFHYKCIRPLLAQHHPGFSCPLCRSFADLEADVETEDAWEVASVRRASIASRKGSIKSLKSVKAAFELGLGHALIAGGEEADAGDADEDGQQGEGSRSFGDSTGEEDGQGEGDVGGAITPSQRMLAAASMDREETRRPDTAVGTSDLSVQTERPVYMEGERGSSEEATPVVRQIDQFASTSSSSPHGSNRSSSFAVSGTPTPSPLGVNNPFATLLSSDSATSASQNGQSTSDESPFASEASAHPSALPVPSSSESPFPQSFTFSSTEPSTHAHGNISPIPESPSSFSFLSSPDNQESPFAHSFSTDPSSASQSQQPSAHFNPDPTSSSSSVNPTDQLSAQLHNASISSSNGTTSATSTPNPASSTNAEQEGAIRSEPSAGATRKPQANGNAHRVESDEIDSSSSHLLASVSIV